MNRTHHHRTGFTLIELTITMAAAGTLMALAIGLVHQTMSLSSKMRSHCDHHRATTRLASQFRSDVHRAQRCAIESPGSLELTLPGGVRISYRAEGNQLTRLQPLGDGTTRREAYALDEHSSASFESLDQPNRAVLTVVRRAEGSVGKQRLDRRVAALVGRMTAHETGEPRP